MKRDKITTITKVTEVGVADYERELYGNLSPVASLVKRGFDVVASLLGLILSSPFFLLIAILIKREDGHSPIYRQERIGYRGKPFTLYKFRSMTICSEKDGKPALCQKDDKRLTKIGRFLRNHHLDELPQLWNVLKGDMSLLFSPATLYNGYTDTMEKMLIRLRMDLDYLRTRTFWLDCKIILLTIASILLGKKF